MLPNSSFLKQCGSLQTLILRNDKTPAAETIESLKGLITSETSVLSYLCLRDCRLDKESVLRLFRHLRSTRCFFNSCLILLFIQRKYISYCIGCFRQWNQLENQRRSSV